MPNSYDDIVNLPRPVSAKHPPMDALSRAAQFAPYAALTGFEAVIAESVRPTDPRRDLGDFAREDLDHRLQILADRAQEHPLLTVTYFLPDEIKDGGRYVTCQGRLKKLRMAEKDLLLLDGPTIPLKEIYALESPLFSEAEASE